MEDSNGPSAGCVIVIITINLSLGAGAGVGGNGQTRDCWQQQGHDSGSVKPWAFMVEGRAAGPRVCCAPGG